MKQTESKQRAQKSKPALQPFNYRKALTSRERDVLEVVCEGLSPQQIAKALGLTLKSARVYVTNLYTKLGVRRRDELLIWAFQHPSALLTGCYREAELHAQGCRCRAPYCALMRRVRRRRSAGVSSGR